VDGTVAATLKLTCFADTTARILVGQTSNYTDAGSHIWYGGSPDQSGMDAASGFGTESAYGYDNGGSWYGTDIQIYKIPAYAGLGDMRFDFLVPNGSYTITGKFANNSSSDQGNMRIEIQGTAQSVIDIATLAGGNNLPWDIATSGITVSNNKLSFILRAVNTVGNGVAPFISAIQIVKN
jgi:hypothetical protein